MLGNNTMNRLRLLWLSLIVTLLPIACSSTGSTLQAGMAQGELVREEGWQLVRDNCTACHSAQIIVQNSGNREVWKSRIEWMQDSQGLGELGPELEGEILDYLVANYGQKLASRRPALPAQLMPINPNL
ncbi:MAG: cytochrome c [Pseudohongiella sp.]|nr:MAG: cytochrome c [Pseudohongiella sp.]